MTRRDTCEMVGKRARKLTKGQAAKAWYVVARRLEEDLSDMDIPKFWDLLVSIRVATILAKKPRFNPHKANLIPQKPFLIPKKSQNT